MDITKTDSMCVSRVGQHSETMPSNYSEQFVESPTNKTDLGRVQQTAKSVNSPQCEEEKTPQFSTSESGSLLREGDTDPLGNSNGASTSPNQVALQKMSSQSSSTSSTCVKDEKDIKKEDPSSSPQNMSPLDFVSAGGGIGPTSRCDKDIKPEPTFNTSSTPSPLTFDKSAAFFRNTTACNDGMDQQQRSTSAGVTAPGSNNSSQIDTNVGVGSGGGALNSSMSPKIKTEDMVANAANNRNIFPFNSNVPKYSQNSAIPQGDSAGSSNEPPDYMQQRNHVFVFSTQLANKSAESVIGGQFPTIIAYHCMQPSTKMFLEDFFKNSAKTTKLQRQYSLNIMNLMQSGGSPGPGAPPNWLNDCNNVGKFPQRLNMRNSCTPGGGGGGGAPKGNRGGEQSQLMNDNQPCLPNTMDTTNNSDNINTKSSMCGNKGDDDMANIHSSLQGVKVPDENLTPQQRQHREEQLAKLKKMNRFLFPEMEGGSGDFAGAQFNNNPGSTDTGSSMGQCSENIAGKMYSGGNNTKMFASGQQLGPNMGDANAHLGAKGQDDVSNSRLMQSIKQEGGIRMPSSGSMCDNNMGNVKGRRPSDAANERGVAGSINSPDMSSTFNMNNSPSSDMMLAQAEWSKFHDDFKGRHAAGNMPGSLPCHPNAPMSRSLSTGVTPYNMQSRPNTGPSPTNRNNNGPPPPYHQTQRSASVPIATQSPNNASPHNTDTSLPSPQASRMAFDMSSTPPNTEVTNPTSSAASTALMALTSGNSKNIFSRDMSNTMSPASSYSNNTLVSPREFDFIEAAGGNKAKRSSPQKCKTPPSLQNMPDMESKYKGFGMNYPPHNMPSQNMRQNMQQMPPQFCRRIDNIPLNPNCNRISQNKATASSFDPIASLAQMSQQLGAIGSMGNSGSASGLNLMDMNTADLMSGPAVGRMGDPSMDHYNQMSNINAGAGGGGGGGRVMGQFPPDINHMLCGDGGPLDQRMLNSKMCGNFAPNSSDLRESFSGCNDMLPSNRGPMYRRGMPPNNFDHFSMSPNIHVRASAPNTIQYMPARSPHMNNMRMPPSNMELFQRYSNPPQGMTNVGGMGHPSGGPMPNDVNANVMNLFGNCNDMPTGQLGGGNELGIEEHLIPNNDYMNVP